LALTEPRISVAAKNDERVEILREAANLSETVRSDAAAAFEYYQRAFRTLPGNRPSEDDLYRLSQPLGNATVLAETIKEVVDLHDEAGEHPEWLAGVRFRMGALL